ncbi:MAG TPA: bifunctional DNA primase/polymerase [Rugosimonospora sp.]|nr:bifunctional DNA primase/polymerase [Rugosimonospora sp.]
MTAPETVLDAALWVARELGWYVFPVDHPDLPQCVGMRTDEHNPATCTKRGKHPCVKFSIDATATARDIIAMFAGTTRNYGVATRQSRIIGIDEDTATLNQFAASIGETVPETFRVRTGRGEHKAFQVPLNTEVTNSRGMLPPGIDVRAGSHGYLIGPGSKHANGTIYTATWDLRPVPAPDWLIWALTTQPASVPSADRDAGHDQVPAKAAELMTEPVQVGDRSEQFHAIVGACKQAGMSPAATVAAVTPWCERVDKFRGRVDKEVMRCWPKLKPPADVLFKGLTLPHGTAFPVPPDAGDRAGSVEAVGDSDGKQGAKPPTPPRIDLDVTNPAEALEWLRNSIGTGPLAGLFDRTDSVVFIAREGESGYTPPTREGDHDGPAQVRPTTPASLASYIDARYRCFRWVKRDGDFDAKPSLFPLDSAKRAIDLPDPDLRPGLRRLAGVIHTPIVRADGSVLDAPGYDPVTRLYHLPDPGLVVPPVPERPTPEHVKTAVALLAEMASGFPWKSENDRANFYGFLITPLLRNLAPPPYKLVIFDAPQQGTGKTLLAELGRILHGGVLRGGVQHQDDAETRKVVTTVLARTTGPVVIFDNLTGLLDSPVLAGLLTSPDWADRLWCATANNFAVGVDMVRRVVWVGIDARMPRPQDRTGFTITDLPGWTRRHRGDLLHALLTLIRAWVAAGRPVQPARSSDGFALWTQAVDAILVHAGIPGRFADPGTARQEASADDDEWGQFLTTAYAVFGTATWTAKELLDRVPTTTFYGLAPVPTPGGFSIDALPGDLAEKAARHPRGPGGLARSLGMWLNNRDGRFVGRLSVRSAGSDGHGTKKWQVVPLATESASGTTGLSGTTGVISPCTSTTQLHGVTALLGAPPQPAPAVPASPVVPDTDCPPARGVRPDNPFGLYPETTTEASVCCGYVPGTTADAPLGLACGLCKNSPTYLGRNNDEDARTSKWIPRNDNSGTAADAPLPADWSREIYEREA